MFNISLKYFFLPAMLEKNIEEEISDAKEDLKQQLNDTSLEIQFMREDIDMFNSTAKSELERLEHRMDSHYSALILDMGNVTIRYTSTSYVRK